MYNLTEMRENNKNITAIDLFAGSGGLSLGFSNAGIKVKTAIEIDQWASDTYAHNFTDHSVITKDIVGIEDDFFAQYAGVDIIMGGPPCQGFSIAASNRRDPNDKRNVLYREYLRAVKAIRPKVVIVENVKEIRGAKIEDGSSLLQDFVTQLERLGYFVEFSLLNAKNFGVPQDRIRFFMICTLTKKFDFESFIKRHGTYDGTIKPFLTLDDAISDLPVFSDGQTIPEDSVLNYTTGPKNEYQEKMRKNSELVYNHIPMRHTSRMIERFKHIQLGNPMASIPEIHSARSRGDSTNLSYKVYHQNHRRLDPSAPSRTITASFYSSFIHPTQNRNLTVREAARVQGYPDHFIFLGKRTTLSKKLLAKKGIHEDLHLDQFNQVGNSVSPILAKKIAEEIKLYI